MYSWCHIFERTPNLRNQSRTKVENAKQTLPRFTVMICLQENKQILRKVLVLNRNRKTRKVNSIYAHCIRKIHMLRAEINTTQTTHNYIGVQLRLNALHIFFMQNGYTNVSFLFLWFYLKNHHTL